MVSGMTDLNSIIAVVIGSLIAMGGLLALATMMEQWMKRDPLADRTEPGLLAAAAGGPTVVDRD
jgi:predicted tellurium resistance membrane protein TerC